MKQATSTLVVCREVTLQTFGKDKYGRTVAEVILPDGTNVNHELVKEGCADGIGNMRRGTKNEAFYVFQIPNLFSNGKGHAA